MESLNIKAKHPFSAPILHFAWKDCEDLNRDLREMILEKREQMPGERMSNVGGWQSPKTLQTWGQPCVRDLLNKIDAATYLLTVECLGADQVESLQKWNIAAWANVNEEGAYNVTHNHSGGVWSGVYYVDSGIPDPDHPYSGILNLRNPTLAAVVINNLRVPDAIKRLFPADYSISPRSGLMVIFPSWLEHQVLPYYGSTPRISVSWDIRFD